MVTEEMTIEGSRAKERKEARVEMAASEDERRKRGLSQTSESEKRAERSGVGL